MKQCATCISFASKECWHDKMTTAPKKEELDYDTGFRDGYRVGVQDGYGKGYDAGTVEGFREGVASVREAHVPCTRKKEEEATNKR